MRFKKSMSVFLSLLLFLSIIFPSGTIASASETTGNSEIVSVSENLEPVENEAVQTLEAETQEAEQKEAENVQEENDQVNVAAEEDTVSEENNSLPENNDESKEDEQMQEPTKGDTVPVDVALNSEESEDVSASEDTEPVENDPVQTSESETQEAEQKETANVQEENDQVNAAAEEDAVSEEKEGSSENNGELKEDEQMQEPTKGDTVPVDETLDSEASQAVEITEPEKNTDLSEKLQDENTVSDDVPAQEEEAETDPISTNEDEAADENVNMVDVPQGRSLLPLKEIRAYLTLQDYDEEQIKNMPLDDVLHMLRDSEGNIIEIPESATAVWTYFKDENDNILKDEYHVIDRNETVDLSLFEYTKDYTMELIVGSGNQLDTNNVRYLVKVYLTSSISETVDYKLYMEGDDGSREEIVPERISTASGGMAGLDLGFDMTSTIFIVPSHQEGAEYYLGITSTADDHPDIKTDVYTFEEFQKFLIGVGGTPITNQILNQDMTQMGAGYKGIYDAPTTVLDWKNIFFMVYTDTSTDTLVSYDMVAFSVVADGTYATGSILAYQDGKMVDATCLSADYVDVNGVVIDGGSGTLEGTDVIHGLYYMLDEEYSIDDAYYCAINIHSEVWENPYEHVEKAVVGLYDSLEEAENQEDIKNQLFPTDQNTLPYGYKADYNYENGGVYFSVFLDDNSVWKFEVRVMGYDPQYDTDYVMSFNEAPVIGSQDPWFRVTGVNDVDGNPLAAYVVENGKEINMDTMYGYGYQTILIQDDVTQIQPSLWYANTDDVKVTSIYINNGQPFQAGDIIDCPNQETNVTFHVTIEDGNGLHTKNYNVKFVKKTSGAKLYVADPKGGDDGATVRSVFLDEYFEFKHDIFIANVGDEPLTGLRVELNATNVKLDDYWTVGGENNDTLAPFTTVSSTTEYGELPNVAKIRLLPDGDGEIDGTLTIYADGQEPVVIKLSGRAQNPKITTSNLDEAVKYVPYSYMVTTNNMYDWTDVEFTMTGELPEGVEFIKSTGEIYGVPQETGEFPISVTANFKSDTYQFDSSSVDLTLKVKDNTNTNVYEATDEGYEILDSIGSDETGTYDFVLTEDGDQMFVSNGEFDNFVDLWLNGEKLIEGEDYTKVAGSTRITIRSQTFKNKANQDGYNTIAAEFRESDSENNELRRTAQNFRLNLSSTTDPDEGTTDPDGGTTNPGGGTTDPDGDTTNPGGGTTNPGGGTSNPGEGTTNPGGGTTNPGGSTTNSGGSATNSDENITNVSVNDEVTDNKEQNVEILVNLVDADDNPLAGYTVEIHSTPQSKITDEEGQARFREIEFGKHTVYVKNSSGEILAQKDLVVQQGKTLALSGDTITTDYGTKFALKIQLDEGQLSFILVQNVTETGDSNNITLWLSLFVLSGLFLTEAVIWYMKRVRNNRREEI